MFIQQVYTEFIMVTLWILLVLLETSCLFHLPSVMLIKILLELSDGLP